ncbi:MAG: suppressor of fused domain protein [Sporichthyaceae bacterium]
MAKSPADIIGKHYRDFFRGHEMFEVDVPALAADRIPGLRMLEVPAGKRVDVVSYATLGCWEAVQSLGVGTEFILAARAADVAHLDSLAAVALAHCATPDTRLDRGSVVPLWRPWLPGSACDRLLVTLPYPYGPELEYCRWRTSAAQFSARVLWLMPITEAEAACVALDGVDGLEARFEAVGVNFADPARPSAL